jgi:hypothetical protein
MKRPKPINRQLSLFLGPEPRACETVAELGLQQQGEVESALADLLLNLAIKIGSHRRGTDDQ